jgi:hypothetical protein
LLHPKTNLAFESCNSGKPSCFSLLPKKRLVQKASVKGICARTTAVPKNPIHPFSAPTVRLQLVLFPSNLRQKQEAKRPQINIPYPLPLFTSHQSPVNRCAVIVAFRLNIYCSELPEWLCIRGANPATIYRTRTRLADALGHALISFKHRCKLFEATCYSRKFFRLETGLSFVVDNCERAWSKALLRKHGFHRSLSLSCCAGALNGHRRLCTRDRTLYLDQANNNNRSRQWTQSWRLQRLRRTMRSEDGDERENRRMAMTSMEMEETRVRRVGLRRREEEVVKAWTRSLSVLMMDAGGATLEQSISIGTN